MAHWLVLAVLCDGNVWTRRSSASVGSNILLISASGRVGSTALLQRFARNHDAPAGTSFSVIREPLSRLPSMPASLPLIERLKQRLRLADDKSTVMHFKFDHLPTDVKLKELLETLRDEFQFGRWILLQRNPIRVDISTQAARKYGWMRSVREHCEAKHSYRVSAAAVMRRACGHHLLWRVVHRVENVSVIGLNYESDMAAGCHQAYSSVAAFFGFQGFTGGNTRHANSAPCPLSSTIHGGISSLRADLIPSLQFMAGEDTERVDYRTFTQKMSEGCLDLEVSEAASGAGLAAELAKGNYTVVAMWIAVATMAVLWVPGRLRP